ncbi:HNH endonuclease signature motif containing protein [Synechococcus sp. WH 8016]|uniref:HNH endonuclease signature motif containing protein n=1 Tax=Synechococcus sp. WH 8016 TaxID=166318 RepID=UPI00022D7D6A|nr:HNH endonuclease signature motif containing protein [Synechococcus sp. WH 8016]EHA63758.1 hypothetical protein Syn8016DRAFT_0799 [Synechococcus sp. WH 8016]
MGKLLTIKLNTENKMIKHKPIPKDISNYLSINPDTGEILRIAYSGSNRTCEIELGTRAGYIDSSGYRKLSFNGKEYLEHRVAWYLYYEEDPGDLTVDHIDRNPTNNKKNNLRLTLQKGQAQNRAALGYSYSSKHNLFIAHLKVNSKSKNLGHYDCPLLARLAYESEAKKHHGDFFCSDLPDNIIGRPKGVEANGPHGSKHLGYTKAGNRFRVIVTLKGKRITQTHHCPLLARYGYIDSLLTLGQAFKPSFIPKVEIIGKDMSDNC